MSGETRYQIFKVVILILPGGMLTVETSVETITARIVQTEDKVIIKYRAICSSTIEPYNIATLASCRYVYILGYQESW